MYCVSVKGFPLIQCGPALLSCDSLDSVQLPQDPKTDKWLRKWSLWIDLNCLLYAKLQKKKILHQETMTPISSVKLFLTV